MARTIQRFAKQCLGFLEKAVDGLFGLHPAPLERDSCSFPHPQKTVTPTRHFRLGVRLGVRRDYLYYLLTSTLFDRWPQ